MIMAAVFRKAGILMDKIVDETTRGFPHKIWRGWKLEEYFPFGECVPFQWILVKPAGV